MLATCSDRVNRFDHPHLERLDLCAHGDVASVIRKLDQAIDRRSFWANYAQPSGKPLLGKLERNGSIRVRLARPSMGGHSLEQTFVGRVHQDGGQVRISGRFETSSGFRIGIPIFLAPILGATAYQAFLFLSGEPSEFARTVLISLPLLCAAAFLVVAVRRLAAQDAASISRILMEQLKSV